MSGDYLMFKVDLALVLISVPLFQVLSMREE